MGADRNQWQFPKNVAGGILGWRDDGKGMANKVIGEDIQEHSPNLDELAEVSPGDAGKSILASSLAADVRNFLDAAPYVETRTALKALDTTKDTLAYLKEAGREGIYKWNSGDFSTQVAADTAEGIYVKADEIAATAGAWVRVEASDVSAFGASASADSAAAVTAMATLLGYVRFPAGGTLIGTDVTVDTPVYFADGAYVNVSAARTLTIRDVVTSPRQWIFRGDGLVSLAHDATLGGENARRAHASWFGAFPQAGVTADQAPAVQKAYTAMGNTREGVIKLDVGNYPFLTGVTTTRGIHLRGEGTRRTVIRCDADGFDAITTGNVAGKISDLQFEVHSSMTTRANAFVRSLHDDFEIYNVNAGQSALGIVVAGGNNCRIRNIKAAYGAAPGAGSSLVKITSGATHSVKGLYLSSSGTFGPDHLVDVDAAASVSNVEIEDIQTINPAVPVRLRASAANISTVSVRNITFAGFAGAIPATVVHLLAEGTSGISGVSVNGIVSNSRPNSAVRIESTSTGVTENIVIDNVILPGATGNGIEFIRSAAGALRDIIIGSAVEVSERATPYAYTGSPTGIRISPTALKDALPVASYDFSIAENSVASINLQRSVFAGWLMIAVGNAERAIYTFRAASSPTITAFGTPSGNMNATNTALPGGAVGKFTTGVTDGVLYFENKLSGTQRVTVTLMTGA
ncbi:hypothetical protein CN085_19765 [Sinorhizobium meliloti]|uniref:hypothetical protein n=1 Tax=Rhizobium meliloti TaxID=382 RepID=UPI000FD7D5B2|nr:hypothetical protein [Sinorhizobium meliloti]RVP13151.1 hypothetical protein CN085_19765 [Sinorhizobium meliloti]